MLKQIGKRRVQQICKKFNLEFYMTPFFMEIFTDYFLFKKTPVHKRIDLRFYSSRCIVVYFYNHKGQFIHEIKQIQSKEFYKVYQYIHECLNYGTEV